MNYADLETRLSELITARAQALRDELSGEIVREDSGRGVYGRPAAPWALAEAREILRRMEVANGGDLAGAILAIATGADREFAVPAYTVPLMPLELTPCQKPAKPSLWRIIERLPLLR